jgi:hypothetical protein
VIASQEINAQIPDLIKILHGGLILSFAVAVVFAGITVFKLRSPPDTYNARLFTFGYFSLSAWILWVIQYGVLAFPFHSVPSSLALTTALWLGVVQNALWACALLALHFKLFSRKLLTLPLLGVFSAVIGLLAYKTSILSSPQLNDSVALFDGFLNCVSFVLLAIAIYQFRLSRIAVVAFLIHGYTQWLWRWLWLTPLGSSIAVQVAFPGWRIVLFIVWYRLISELISAMSQRVPPEEPTLPPQVNHTAGSGTQPITTPDLSPTLRVMISSTVEDLGPERDAADQAIHGLKYERFRAETLGSLPHSPEMVCAYMAEKCDVFVLIIGERYGYEIKSKKQSVVEFEYEHARARDRGKILVYIKEGVTREPRLETFVKRVEDFESGHFRTLFKTADELPLKIQGDIARWVLLRTRQNIH